MIMVKRLLIFIFIIIILGLLAYFYPYLAGITGEAVSNEIEYEKQLALMIKAIDGDTIEVFVDNSTEKVRLLGINTPEKGKPYYQEAKKFLQEFENKTIEILRDWEDEDKYDRKLRYVFYNNRLLNIEILQEGLATSYMIDELDYKDKIIDAEDFAKNSGIGLWEKSKHICVGCIELLELNAEEEYFIIVNNCEFNCNIDDWVVKDDANHFFYLKNIKAEETHKYHSKSRVWNNDGDRFFMRDSQGKLVIFYEYKDL